MVWTHRPVTAANLKPSTIDIRDGAAWVKLQDGRLATSLDYETWHVNPWPADFDFFRALTWTGSYWLMVDNSNRILRSLDGVVGVLWSVSYPTNLPTTIAAIGYVASGRMVAIRASAPKTIWVSDDDGLTWTQTGLVSPSGSGAESIAYYPEIGAIFAHTRSTTLARSDDNGQTWVYRTPLSAKSITRTLYNGHQFVFDTHESQHLSYNVAGESWSIPGDNQLNDFAARSQVVAGGVLYDLTITNNVARVRSHQGVIDSNTLLQDVDVSGLPTLIRGTLHVRPDRLIVTGLRTGGYSYDEFWTFALTPPADYVATPWPVVVEEAIRASAPWPVEVAAAPALRAVTPWRVTVATAQQAATSWPVQVLDAALIGGLDGAASWAAAPDGRWEAVVWLGDDNISARITGAVSVQIEADAARTAEFAFLPAAPIQPLGLIGQRVRIAFAQAGGLNAQTIFRGVVETPSIDLQTRVITCACHDQAQEVWTNTPREAIDALVGGRWHEAVSGEPEDNFEYMRERIQSVGASWALDANQAPRVLPWASPGRTVTVRQADIIDGSLAVDLPSREQLRTRIDVRMQYRYPVHRARGISAQWSQPLGFFLPSITATQNKPNYTMPTVGMIEAASENPPGWELVKRTIENPPAGSWNLGSALSPAFFVIPASVAPSLAIGFSGLYRTRWQQTVTEDYSITVVWGALEAQIGQPVGEETGATLESSFESPGWGSDPSIAPTVNVAGVGDVSVPYYAPGAAPADRDEVLRTLLDRAWMRMWSASRTGRVRFALPCRPDLWLDTGCILEGGRVRASGVIVALEHVLDVDAGQATTDIAVAVGMPGATPASLPDWDLPASPYTAHPPQFGQLSATIGTYVGGLDSSPPYDPETMIGLVTNADGGGELPGREYYPVGLTIGWPALTAEDRDPRELAALAEISVAVPTDLLEIT